MRSWNVDSYNELSDISINKISLPSLSLIETSKSSINLEAVEFVNLQNITMDLEHLKSELEQVNDLINGDPDLNLTQNFRLCNTPTNTITDDLSIFTLYAYGPKVDYFANIFRNSISKIQCSKSKKMHENAISEITQLLFLIRDISPIRLLQNDPEIFIIASSNASTPNTEESQSPDFTT